MRDPFFKLDILTPAKIWHAREIFTFLCLSGDFGHVMTSGRFDKGYRDP
jgi:hypothetical protein